MRIENGVSDQVVYFLAAPGITSDFTVNRSRNGSVFVEMTTPTVVELPGVSPSVGVYRLLLDEDMTMDSGNSTESIVFLVQNDGMTDQLLEHELFDSSFALDTVIPELGVATPASTPTIRTALMLLYMALRNKRDTTAAVDEIHNNAGAVIADAAVSDDTVTFSKAKYVAP